MVETNLVTSSTLCPYTSSDQLLIFIHTHTHYPTQQHILCVSKPSQSSRKHGASELGIVDPISPMLRCRRINLRWLKPNQIGIWRLRVSAHPTHRPHPPCFLLCPLCPSVIKSNQIILILTIYLFIHRCELIQVFQVWERVRERGGDQAKVPDFLWQPQTYQIH